MLLGGNKSDIKQVAIVTRNVEFNRLLACILSEWKFVTVDDPQEAKIVFVERGLDAPEGAGQVIWLTPMPLHEGSFILTPVSLTRLYHLLEVHFFPTPRRHIRVAYDSNMAINHEGKWFDCMLMSISDRGCRMTCDIEIPRGTTLQVEADFNGQRLVLPAEVLYCIPAGDSLARSKPNIGILFKPSEEKIITSIRKFIEIITVERARVKENLPRNSPCLSWFDLSDDPWS